MTLTSQSFGGMGHTALIVGIVFFILAALLFFGDFMDTTDWSFGRPEMDWWSIVCGLIALVGFAGLAYVIWSQ